MMTARLTIVSDSGLIMSNPAWLDVDPLSCHYGEKYNARDDANKRRYLTKDGKYLCLPAQILERTIYNASKCFRMLVGRRQRCVHPILGGTLFISPDEIPLANPRTHRLLRATEYTLYRRRICVNSHMFQKAHPL